MRKQEYYMYKQAFVAPRPGQPGYQKFDWGLDKLLPALGMTLGGISDAYKHKTGKNSVLTRAGDVLGAAGKAAYTIQNPITTAGMYAGDAVGRAVGGNNPYGSIIGSILGGLPGVIQEGYNTWKKNKNQNLPIMY